MDIGVLFAIPISFISDRGIAALKEIFTRNGLPLGVRQQATRLLC